MTQFNPNTLEFTSLPVQHPNPSLMTFHCVVLAFKTNHVI